MAGLFSQMRFEPTGWTSSGVLAVLAHAGVAAAMILQIDFSRAQSPPPAMMVVELAALPTAPPVPKTAIPIGPEKQEQVRAQPKPLKKPLFDPPPEVKTPDPPEMVVRKPEEQQQTHLAAAETIEQTTAPQAMEAPPEKALAAPVSAASTRAQVDAQATWEGSILARLERQKRYPKASRARREEDVVYVKFTVNRKGDVIATSIVRSNGFNLLDGEVVELLKRASPLPPPPPEVSGSQIEMVVPVEFYLRPGRV